MKLLAILSSFVLLTACLLRPPTAAKKFIALQHKRDYRPRIMVDSVHEPHWDISYSYGADCPAEQRNNDNALTEAITAVLQMWLQPLREYENKQGKIVADFRYLLGERLPGSHLSVVFHCDQRDNSSAFIGEKVAPLIRMRKGTQVVGSFMFILAHEVGHAFGLADTYIPEAKRDELQHLDKGGLDSGLGTQPASAMMLASGLNKDGEMLGRDDKNGVLWLYKQRYEGLSLKDCFFDDYELEHVPLGCRPKYPLIFAIKYGLEIGAIIVLEQDENLAVNARDAEGMTALHHAVQHRYQRLAQKLLQHADTKPFLTNEEGKTPLELAKELGHDELAQLIAAHPKAMPVAAKGKQTTTWGELKKEE